MVHAHHKWGLGSMKVIEDVAPSRFAIGEIELVSFLTGEDIN